MTSRFPPFAFVELVSPYNKKNITRWLEDMNFMFSWQEQYLTGSRRYCSCHSNIKFISSRHRVISSIYLTSEIKNFLDLFSTLKSRAQQLQVTFKEFWDSFLEVLKQLVAKATAYNCKQSVFQPGLSEMRPQPT